jgi:hypothetical protein
MVLFFLLGYFYNVIELVASAEGSTFSLCNYWFLLLSFGFLFLLLKQLYFWVAMLRVSTFSLGQRGSFFFQLDFLSLKSSQDRDLTAASNYMQLGFSSYVASDTLTSTKGFRFCAKFLSGKQKSGSSPNDAETYLVKSQLISFHTEK